MRNVRLAPLFSGLVFGAGVLAAAAAVYVFWSRPRLAVVPLQDPKLQQSLAEMSAATPERAAQLESQLAKAYVRLPKAAAFDAWMAEREGAWKIEARSTESSPGIEVRHYSLSFNNPLLGAWPDILAAVNAFCDEPGLTIDRFDLALAREGDRFDRAQVVLSARLRP